MHDRMNRMNRMNKMNKMKICKNAQRETTLRRPLRRRCALGEPLTLYRNCGALRGSRRPCRRGGKHPTTTKWLDRWKADVKGGCFVRCRLVGRNFKVEGVEKREDVFAAVTRLESKKLMFRMVAAAREQRRRREPRGDEADVY